MIRLKKGKMNKYYLVIEKDKAGKERNLFSSDTRAGAKTLKKKYEKLVDVRSLELFVYIKEVTRE